MRQFILVPFLIYNVVIKENRKDDILENGVSRDLVPTKKLEKSNFTTLEETSESISEIQCFKNPSYSSMTSTIQGVTFLGVPDSSKEKSSEILSSYARKTATSLLLDNNCVPIFLDLERFNYEPGKFADYLRCLAFSKDCMDITKTFGVEKMYDDYFKYNESYYNNLRRITEVGDRVIVFDPELWLVPSLFDNSTVSICIVFLIPVFTDKSFESLYKNTEILMSILSAHLIFQSQSELDAFLDLCEIHVPNFEETTISKQVLPIGIDLESVEEVKGANFDNNVTRIKTIHRNRKVITTVVTRENIDFALNFLESFDKICAIEEAVLIQIVHHGNLLDKKKLKRIENYAKMICAKHGADKVSTVIPKSDHEYYVLLAAANLGLFLFDNSISNKSCCDFVDVNSAPFLQSNTFSSLFTSLLVDPNNVDSLYEKIRKGLGLEDELAFRNNLQTLQAIQTSGFLSKIDIKTIKSKHEIPPPINESAIIDKFKKAKSKVFILDYDGTLREICKTPSEATTTPEIKQVINNLLTIENLTLVISTGRSKEDAQSFFPDPRIIIYAEHSVFRRINGKWGERELDISWKPLADDIMTNFVNAVKGSEIEVKNTALVLHYRNAETEHLAEKVEECRKTLVGALRGTANVKAGKCIVEVNCKGVAKDYVVKQFPGADFGLCAGDDTTDEKMFGFKGFTSIVVGKKESKAEYSVRDPQEFRNFLKKFN